MARPLSDTMFAQATAAASTKAAPGVIERTGQAPFVTIFAETAQTLEQHLVQWQELEQNAIEPSVIGAPAWQVPMFKHMRQTDPSLDIMLVADEVAPHRLRGVIPFQLQTRRWGLPVPMIASWTNDLFFAGTPLIGKSNPQSAVHCALSAAAATHGAKVALFQMVPATSPFIDTLQAIAGKYGLPIAQLEPFERAGLVCDTDYESWFNQNFQRKRRKEFRRLRARLAEAGELEFCVRKPGEPLQDWISQFMQLEQSGWKGRRGTAVACLDDVTAFLNETLGEFDRTNRQLFWRLSLDGKTIATLFGIICGRKAWLIKIAYDEDYARYSPGALLILDATSDLLARHDIDIVDSSAVPDHPMINHLWRDRLAMNDIMIATPGTSHTLFKILVGAEKFKRRARATLKSLYLRYLKGDSK